MKTFLKQICAIQNNFLNGFCLPWKLYYSSKWFYHCKLLKSSFEKLNMSRKKWVFWRSKLRFNYAAYYVIRKRYFGIFNKKQVCWFECCGFIILCLSKKWERYKHWMNIHKNIYKNCVFHSQTLKTLKMVRIVTAWICATKAYCIILFMLSVRDSKELGLTMHGSPIWTTGFWTGYFYSVL